MREVRAFRRRAYWLALAAILLAAALLVAVAPEERTLGAGIKVVYVHVALVWSGMAGLALAGALGLGVLVTASVRLHAGMRAVTWVALGLFIAGLAMSALAARLNWGAVFLGEPRVAAALEVFALGVIVQVVNGWLPWLRARGALNMALVGVMAVRTMTITSVLHPTDPIGSSSSCAIQTTFLAMFALCCLAGAWLVGYVLARRGAAQEA